MWFLAARAFAHDMWLEIDPEEQSLRLDGFVGEHLTEAEPYRLGSLDRVARFELRGPDGTADQKATVRVDRDELAEIPVAADGTFAVVLETTPVPIGLPAATFDGYLQEEGLTDVIAARVPGSAGRERYSRTVVALAGRGAKGAIKRSADVATAAQADLHLQIVPDDNPLLAKPGERLTFKVLFEGAPLADRQVMAASRVGDDVTSRLARTDAEGRVTFDVDREALWIVRLVHMIPSTEPGADWRSYWSALTFPVGAS